ncbi:MAG: replication-associated protein [Gemycircularvirus mouti8]|uniref:replication-associated protein n=1 Tax=Genomoviridae sp. TaxID=2202565 RepID=UPI002481F23A|nr:MAG: replication-associated protein [Genomoviridae sp.]QCW23725.1 MAG: replication-associated protein [Genomoviridae sp.]
MPSAFLVKDAKYLLLTYSAVPARLVAELPVRIVSRCADVGAECLVGQEIHPTTGGTHFHAFVDFGGSKYSTRDARAFDIEGIHPNIEKGGRTPWKIYDYVSKDGDIVAGGAERPEETGHEGSSDGVSKWQYITEAVCRDEFFSRIRERDPRVLVTAFGNVVKYADWQYRVDPVAYQHPESFSFDLGDFGDLRDWADDNLRGGVEVRPKSLVLFGPTRTGKTVWARSLGRHLYFCGLYSYKEANKADEAQYAVFDDIQGGIKFFPSFKNWLGGQEEFQIKGLYRDPEIIKWGKPSVWISNTDPRHDMSLADVEWMEGNCTFVEVRHPMFRASSM